MTGHTLVAWGMGVMVVAAVLPVTVFADGGLFTQTKHGNSTTGVQRDTSLPQGSCVQCHTGHSQNPQDFGLWAANDNNICFTCHANSDRSYAGQTTYSLSGHSTSAATLNQEPVGQCDQCHNPHGAGDTRGLYPNLTAKDEEQVCYTCHGSGIRPQGAADIQTPSTKRYAHAVGNYERLHDDAAEFNSSSTSPNPQLSGSSRHVECADCHNTHTGRTAPRPDHSSNIGEMMLGSWGVRPMYAGTAWAAPTSFVVERFQNTATEYESYLCYKCHTSYAWGSVAPTTADGKLETNAALEFNPNNPSYHNVMGQPESSVPTEDTVDGGTGAAAYVNGWGPNSAMACTDCHAGDPGSGSARGAHGSNYAYLLKNRFKADAGALDNTGRAGTQADLCFNCHDYNTYGEGGTGTDTNFTEATGLRRKAGPTRVQINEIVRNRPSVLPKPFRLPGPMVRQRPRVVNGVVNLHALAGHAQAGCFQCHAAVPHGFKRKHMIVYVTDGAPYYQSDPVNYSLLKGGIEQYSHEPGGSYTVNDCKAACHEAHQTATPVNPLP